MVFARVWVVVLALAVGIVSWITVSHLLSKLAPLIISSLSSLFSAVWRDEMVRKGVRSSLKLNRMTGMWADISEASVFVSRVIVAIGVFVKSWVSITKDREALEGGVSQLCHWFSIQVEEVGVVFIFFIQGLYHHVLEGAVEYVHQFVLID